MIESSKAPPGEFRMTVPPFFVLSMRMVNGTASPGIIGPVISMVVPLRLILAAGAGDETSNVLASIATAIALSVADDLARAAVRAALRPQAKSIS